MSFFFKNKNNVKINPATDDTLLSIKSKTDSLTFDNSTEISSLNVNVNTQSSVNAKKIDNTNVNPATEDTLGLIQTKTSSLQFDNKYNLKISGNIPTLDSAVQTKNINKCNVSPTTNEKVLLLRRMVKMLESQVNTDLNNNQRVTVDGFVAITGTGPSGIGIPLVTIANDSTITTGTVTGLTTGMTTFGGWNGQIFQDTARNAFARGIRRKLNFN